MDPLYQRAGLCQSLEKEFPVAKLGFFFFFKKWGLKRLYSVIRSISLLEPITPLKPRISELFSPCHESLLELSSNLSGVELVGMVFVGAVISASGSWCIGRHRAAPWRRDNERWVKMGSTLFMFHLGTCSSVCLWSRKGNGLAEWEVSGMKMGPNTSAREWKWVQTH